MGINFEKAIFGCTSLSVIPTVLEDNYQNIMQMVASNQLGFNINCFIEMDLEAFDTIFSDLLNLFKQYHDWDNSHEKVKIVAYETPKELKLCLKAVLDGIKNDKSYGGNGMWVEPIFKARDITVDPNMCFCVLPFNDDRLDILDKLIKPEIEEKFNLTVIRSGNIFEPNQNIMESIWTYINQAAFVIVDISDANPNFFYELGICHTLGKPVITLCDKQSWEDDYKRNLPFDISSINTIFYDNSAVGAKNMMDSIKKDIIAIRSGKPYIE